MNVSLTKFFLKLESERSWLFIVLVLWRCLNACLVQTQFVPDEYWQGPEVAHLLVYGTGHLTWEWDLAIRSALHPGFLAAFTFFFRLCGLHSQTAVLWSYSLPHVLLAAIGDISLFTFALKCSDSRRVARFALFIQLLSWFHTYTCTRTLSNSFETALLIFALAHWPFPTSPLSCWAYVSFTAASLAVIVRPPCIVFFGALSLLTLSPTKLLRAVSLGLLLLVTTSLALDYWFYNRLTLPLLNFFHQNIVLNIASAYGTHPALWYLSGGLPTVLLTLFPLSLLGVWVVVVVRTRGPVKGGDVGNVRGTSTTTAIRGMNTTATATATSTSSATSSVKSSISRQSHYPTLKLALLAGLAYLVALSVSPHKELRFLQPLLPLAHILSALALTRIFPVSKGETSFDKQLNYHSDSSPRSSKPLTSLARVCSLPTILLFLAITHVPVALYTCLVHNRSPLDTVNYLSARLPPLFSSTREDDVSTPHILFLTPCHATPLHSHLHARVTTTFLHCETVPSHTSLGPDANEFYADPLLWLQTMPERTWQQQSNKLITSPPLSSPPQFIVLFDSLVPTIETWLVTQRYELVARFFHTHFPESRTGAYMLVYERM
eukprot:m.20531 g.20531  ORF g.20531 m.20531 type:complete len:605 (-) comp7862_c0_seq3:40-1854(-)